ncbi:protein of unknown function [Candidatus Nitrosocosmicus franklandus]|uniref:Uncharacterized protein n=1 Tax=Candidatus Nitrosocosmicus franklandianus TaxID=1798806 RepID=A0A484I914_9ARCH|nr:protein of unknown function [Candidatus Nitrosocosmicus franklandus]
MGSIEKTTIEQPTRKTEVIHGIGNFLKAGLKFMQVPKPSMP